MMRPSIPTKLPLVAALSLIIAAISPSAAPLDAAQPTIEPAAPAPAIPAGAFQVTIAGLEVLDDGKQVPLDRHLVLFETGKAYDFALSDPRDVTVIDPVAAQVTLLSRVDHVKSTIAHQDILTAAARVKSYAKKQGLEKRLGINAKAEKTADPLNSYRVAFAGYQYDATSSAPAAAMQPARFAEFTDWVTRVNLIRKLGTPPFARMTLGRTIASDGLIPTTVTLKLTAQDRKRTFLSRYTFKEGLSPEGDKRIDEVAAMIRLYREVPLEAF